MVRKDSVSEDDDQIARRRAELAERRAEFGTMAAAIAHQINNPLAIINVHLELVKDELETLRAKHRDDAKRFADIFESWTELEAAVQAVTQITSDMRAFTSSSPPATGDLKRAIEWAVKTAAPHLRDRARPLTKLEVGGRVAIDEPRLGRMLVHLLRNAAAAINLGAAEKHEVSVVTRAGQGKRVLIEIRDTGRGISEDRLVTIFEPQIQAGRVELGLCECREIAEAAGGTISIESEVGQGTVVTVDLPLA
ncbi:MAG: HAMP domain-containing sensor histidine kinase [Kofleriaceae bacterium]